MPAAETAHPPTLIPARPDPRVARFFAWYTRRLFSKRFFAVRLMPGSRECLRSTNAHDGPAIIVMTHGSWWDPMTAILLHHHPWGHRHKPARAPAAPMDSAMLKRFGFFRRLGVFGIDPDSPASLQAMGAYMLERFRAEPRTTLWVTAQGHFHDPRTPPKLRPGAAWLAARTPNVRVLCCAIEYAFWTDQRPEVFVRVQQASPAPSPAPSPSTTDWLRAMQSTMEACAAALAQAVMSRDPAYFEPLQGAGPTSINPLYDLWQRVTGKGNAIEVRAQPTPKPAASTPEVTP